MARQKSKKWSDYLWLVSATYFTLGFFNIVFAWLGVICFMIPLFYGSFRRRQGILQQLLWTRSAFPADRKHPGMVAQEGSAKMVIIQMVPSWIPALLHVLLHPDDHPHSDGDKGSRESPSDHSSALDL